MSKPEKEVDYAGCSAGCLGALLDFTLLPLLYGWAITVLWRWFIVPTFGLKPLSLAAAIGLDLVVSLLTAVHHLSDSRKEYRARDYLLRTFAKTLYPFMALLVGWLALRVLA